MNTRNALTTATSAVQGESEAPMARSEPPRNPSTATTMPTPPPPEQPASSFLTSSFSTARDTATAVLNARRAIGVPRLIRMCYGADRKPGNFDGLQPLPRRGSGAPGLPTIPESRDQAAITQNGLPHGVSEPPSFPSAPGRAGMPSMQQRRRPFRDAFRQRLLCMGPRPGKEGGLLGVDREGSSEASTHRVEGAYSALTDEALLEREEDYGYDDEGDFDDARSDFYSQVDRLSNYDPTEIAGILSVSASGYQTPLSDLLQFVLGNFEERRMRFNTIQGKIRTGNGVAEVPADWDRTSEMRALAELLVDTSRACMNEDPNVDCALAYNHHGVKVWKKEFGVGRLLLRAEWVVPVAPKQYCEYASDVRYRKIWDSNCAEVQRLETLGDGIDLCYVATKRVATIFPRDTVNLRIVRPLDPSSPLDCAYSSCSCSIEHPEIGDRPGKVRADLRIASYVANPLPTPFGLWSRICLFNEGDPRGWIPAAVTKLLAVKVVPSSVEKVTKAIMEKHTIAWDGEKASGWAATQLDQAGFVIPPRPKLPIADAQLLLYEQSLSLNASQQQMDEDGPTTPIVTLGKRRTSSFVSADDSPIPTTNHPHTHPFHASLPHTSSPTAAAAASHDFGYGRIPMAKQIGPMTWVAEAPPSPTSPTTGMFEYPASSPLTLPEKGSSSPEASPTAAAAAGRVANLAGLRAAVSAALGAAASMSASASASASSEPQPSTSAVELTPSWRRVRRQQQEPQAAQSPFFPPRPPTPPATPFPAPAPPGGDEAPPAQQPSVQVHLSPSKRGDLPSIPHAASSPNVVVPKQKPKLLPTDGAAAAGGHGHCASSPSSPTLPQGGEGEAWTTATSTTIRSGYQWLVEKVGGLPAGNNSSSSNSNSEAPANGPSLLVFPQAPSPNEPGQQRGGGAADAAAAAEAKAE
ncbi:unnamed protein product [Vitrella brassicaformis CCMP3155]|uniref:START domain-containing protein n=1 Tax=Vitrella brassicaformis (strain CCMP3155) TaxID=1169540 RepID=A0A0G4GLI6_VITBC|nr:unnamed protein product [Vitrella brassicaformis CCMP3155]|eukprot:CEM30981.1 unnamed protein product [Vitrella brassicaformis CCMP3155]